MFWSGYPVFFYNIAVTTHRPDSIASFFEALRETKAYTAERAQPWMFVLCHETMGDLLPAVQDALRQEGLVPVMPLTGMEDSELTPG